MNPLYDLAHSYAQSLVFWIRTLNHEIDTGGVNIKAAEASVGKLWQEVESISQRVPEQDFWGTVRRLVKTTFEDEGKTYFFGHVYAKRVAEQLDPFQELDQGEVENPLR